MNPQKPNESQADSPASFRTTRWTKIAAASGTSSECRQALEERCEAYYRPVSSFIRWRTGDTVVAKDLTQEFFADFLGRKSLGKADRTKGRFRSYLLGAVNHFLSDQQKSKKRAKRGGKVAMISLDVTEDHPNADPIEIADPKQPNPEKMFDREWALTLLDRAILALEEEERSKGREKPFTILKPWLTGGLGDEAQSDAATQLGLSTNATKVAIHRLRRRFRHQVQLEIAHTVNHASEIREELRYLKEVLSS